MEKLFFAEEMPTDKRTCSPTEELERELILFSPQTHSKLWEMTQAEARGKNLPSSQGVDDKQIGVWD